MGPPRVCGSTARERGGPRKEMRQRAHTILVCVWEAAVDGTLYRRFGRRGFGLRIKSQNQHEWNVCDAYPERFFSIEPTRKPRRSCRQKSGESNPQTGCPLNMAFLCSTLFNFVPPLLHLSSGNSIKYLVRGSASLSSRTVVLEAPISNS